jgi:hypothetical protein
LVANSFIADYAMSQNPQSASLTSKLLILWGKQETDGNVQTQAKRQARNDRVKEVLLSPVHNIVFAVEVQGPNHTAFYSQS